MSRFFAWLAVSILLAACGDSTFEAGSAEPGADAGAEGPADASGSGGSSGAGDGSAGSGGTGGTAGTGGSGGSGGAAGVDGGTDDAGNEDGAVGDGGDAGPGATATPECERDDECSLSGGCCSCAGLAKGEAPPDDCPTNCLQSACDAAGIKSAKCAAGRCVAGFACDAKQVTCRVAVPDCPAGLVPVVRDSCYSGQCVRADECVSVTGCDDCNDGLACARYLTQAGIETHCVRAPDVCAGDDTCACLGPSVCVGSFSSCDDLSSVKAIGCSCPAC